MHSLLSKPGFDITVLSDIGAEVCVGTVQLKESWKFGRDLYLWWCRYSLPHILPWFWAVFWTRLCCRSCAIKASLNFKPELLDFNRGPFAFSALGPLLTLNMENSWFLIWVSPTICWGEHIKQGLLDVYLPLPYSELTSPKAELSLIALQLGDAGKEGRGNVLNAT